jgi:hypothetical protein
MAPVSFELLNKKYGLSFGDTYKHLSLPKSVLEYSIEEKREFIRGLADATAHFDQGPYWYGDILLSNPRLCRDCLFPLRKMYSQATFNYLKEKQKEINPE